MNGQSASPPAAARHPDRDRLQAHGRRSDPDQPRSRRSRDLRNEHLRLCLEAGSATLTSHSGGRGPKSRSRRCQRTSQPQAVSVLVIRYPSVSGVFNASVERPAITRRSPARSAGNPAGRGGRRQDPHASAATRPAGTPSPVRRATLSTRVGREVRAAPSDQADRPFRPGSRRPSRQHTRPARSRPPPIWITDRQAGRRSAEAAHWSTSLMPIARAVRVSVTRPPDRTVDPACALAESHVPPSGRLLPRRRSNPAALDRSRGRSPPPRCESRPRPLPAVA